MITITTVDPRFDPDNAIMVNGFLYVPAAGVIEIGFPRSILEEVYLDDDEEEGCG